MFSALKKLVGSEQAPGRDKNIPAGLQSMNQTLQRRFAKGVQYNSESRPPPTPGTHGTPGFDPAAKFFYFFCTSEAAKWGEPRGAPRGALAPGVGPPRSARSA